jgi:DMSO reductase anchor subunit
MTRGREWPLVAFTLLTQTAVGAFVALGVIRSMLAPRLAASEVASVIVGPMAVLEVVFLAGVAASLGHLARPLGAWRAVRNVGQSWLSLEVVLALGFGVASVLFVLAQRSAPVPSLVTGILGGTAAVSGVGMVGAMSLVYRLPARPAWRHLVTPVGFFLTAGLVGTALVAESLAAFAGGMPPVAPDRLPVVGDALQAAVRVTAALAACELLHIVWHARIWLRANAGSSLPARLPSRRRWRRALVGRLALTTAAAAAACYVATNRPALPGLDPGAAGPLVAVLLLVTIESWIGRTWFYHDRPVAGV